MDRPTVKGEQARQGKAGLKTILVAVDFSPCSRLAFQRALALLPHEGGRIVLLHVIDRDFVDHCIEHHLGEKGEIKKSLFLEAKKRLHNLLHKENLDGTRAEAKVCEGVPFLEINRQAVEVGADLTVIGTCGRSGDMHHIFFGSTAEKVLRFITRPVLCVPPDTR